MKPKLIFIAISLCFILMLVPKNVHVASITPIKTIELIKITSQIYNLDWKLVTAIAVVESHFNPRAVSRDGKDRGLMQVRDVLAKHFNVPIKDLFNTRVNLHVACQHLSYLIDRYGLHGGIQAYHIGETRYNRGVRNRTYLNRVLRVHRGINVVTEE